MPTRRASQLVQPVGTINSQTTPQVVTGLDSVVQAGDLIAIAVFYAQATAISIPAPNHFLKATTDGTGTTRSGAIHWAIVEDPADFASISLGSPSTASRVPAVIQVWTPDAGKKWDPASVIAAGPEYNASAATSDTFPTLAARDLKLGVSMTNKSASTTPSTHTAAGGGSNTDQANAPSTAYPSSASDSVTSMTKDGTGVTFNVSQANAVMYSFGINQIDISTPAPELPVVTGKGFGTVKKFMQTFGATMAHRNLGATYGEMTEYGARMAANHGQGVIEISCQRTSDGVWMGIHDQYLDRVMTGTTGTTYPVASMTWAAIQAAGAVVVGSSGAPQPFATMQEIIETLPSDFIFLVDPKQQAASYMTEFLDLVDTLLGPTRAIIKIDGAAVKSRFESAQARGYKTMAYFYDTTPSATIADRMSAVDIPGLNYECDQSYWDALKLYGKPIWGHVCVTQANADMAMAKGASFVQCTSTSIAPVGVNKWRPGIAKDNQFGPKEIMVGSSTVKKIYRGTTLLYEASA